MAAEKRRRFSRDFKLEAVRQVTDGRRPLAEVARELHIRADMLHKWLRAAGTAPSTDAVFPGNGRVSAEDEEIRRLRRELAQVREERDILKKATAYCAKQSRCRTPLSTVTVTNTRSPRCAPRARRLDHRLLRLASSLPERSRSRQRTTAHRDSRDPSRESRG
jgi:transposase